MARKNRYAYVVNPRVINNEDWKPLPGMTKLKCSICLFWFASYRADAARCPDCVEKQQRTDRGAVRKIKL